ncbi:MAG TPA: hypothetical protein VK660_10545 [Xanthomonadaceae bacterium]|jgi:hypothetical protein|nr:hypothetical protein [Xanthomonadaceae bacterium]
MSSKQLFDEDTWLGKIISLVLRAGQVAIVLVFFFGIFAVIGANWVADRFRRKPTPIRAART